MSQLDVMNAKQALAWRLRTWGLEGDVAKMADGFIEDLVRIGWQMSPDREHRIHPPKADEECPNHPGQHRPPFCGACRTVKAADADDSVSPNLPSVAEVNPRLAKRIADRLGGAS